MNLDLKKRFFKQIKKIQNLYNNNRPFGKSSQNVQQACTSNLLVTVFAAHRLESSHMTNILLTLFNCGNGMPTLKELTAIPHNHGANTAP
jgi:hypothetical protein